jgi:hypothetical protein
MPTTFSPLVVAIFFGLMVALCVAGWLQWRRTLRLLRAQEAVSPRGSGKAPAPSKPTDPFVRAYVRESNVGLGGFAVVAADLAYAVVSSELGLMANFSAPAFVLIGFLGIVLLWVSAYRVSRLLRRYGAELNR